MLFANLLSDTGWNTKSMYVSFIPTYKRFPVTCVGTYKILDKNSFIMQLLSLITGFVVDVSYISPNVTSCISGAPSRMLKA